MRLGLAGPTYQSQSPNVSADFTMNLYPELVESGRGKANVVLYPTPGLSLFAALGGNQVRGLHVIKGRTFAVVDGNLYELFSDATSSLRGAVDDDGLPAFMAASLTQLLVSSGGKAYVLTLATNVFASVPVATLVDISQVAYVDGYFLALVKNSNTFRISTLLDAADWPASQFVAVSVFPDNVVSMIADHRELWLLGTGKGVVYYNSGSLSIFDVIPGSHIEQGAIAANATVNLDNTIFFLGGDSRGGLVAFRAQGFTPARVSNHAVEQSWQGYANPSDALGFPYQDRGHAFWFIYFPSANRTWVYDVATGMWHERGFFQLGNFQAHLARNHVYAFNKHLVGARNSGNIYEMSIDFLDDAGSPLRRVRRAPHFSEENKWTFHHKLQLDLETGLGPTPPLLDGNGVERSPMVNLRWSDDGGHVWSNYHTAEAGKAGEFKTRVIWWRLGRSRDRVYEVSMTDPVPWRIIDAYLEATQGTGA